MFEKETERAYYTFSEIQEIKKYYIDREKWYELAILSAVVFGFLLGLAI